MALTLKIQELNVDVAILSLLNHSYYCSHLLPCVPVSCIICSRILGTIKMAKSIGTKWVNVGIILSLTLPRSQKKKKKKIQRNIKEYLRYIISYRKVSYQKNLTLNKVTKKLKKICQTSLMKVFMTIVNSF